MLFRGLSAAEVDAIYRRYGVMLVRRCRLLLRDATLADDAMQEFLSMLLRRGSPLHQAASPYRWLCRALDRVCLDTLRRGKRTRDALSISNLDTLGAPPGIDAEARCVVLESLETLSPEEQSLAIMLFVDGLTQSEAAEELGVSRITINKRAQDIRSRLRFDLLSTTEVAT